MGFLKYARRSFYNIVASIWELVVVGWLTFYYTTESTVKFLTPNFLRAQKSLKDKVVVVTGAAGGVGQELTLRLARIKAKVVAWDINEAGICTLKTGLFDIIFVVVLFLFVSIGDTEREMRGGRLQNLHLCGRHIRSTQCL